MFDLIDESGKDLNLHGYKIKKEDKFAISVAKLFVDEKKSKELRIDEGEYRIINSPFLHEFKDENEKYLIPIIAENIKQVFRRKGVKKGENTLIACLGNPEIEGDRLGKEVFDCLELPMLSKETKIYKFCPNIYLFTGVETAKIVEMFVSSLNIKTLIVIDSLLTTNLSRIGCSFQISTGGMTPGSGVNRFGKPITEEDLSAKCISIGVPFMISSQTLKSDEKEMILVPKDVTDWVKRAGRIIASALVEVMI